MAVASTMTCKICVIWRHIKKPYLLHDILLLFLLKKGIFWSRYRYRFTAYLWWTVTNVEVMMSKQRQTMQHEKWSRWTIKLKNIKAIIGNHKKGAETNLQKLCDKLANHSNSTYRNMSQNIFITKNFLVCSEKNFLESVCTTCTSLSPLSNPTIEFDSWSFFHCFVVYPFCNFFVLSFYSTTVLIVAALISTMYVSSIG